MLQATSDHARLQQIRSDSGRIVGNVREARRPIIWWQDTKTNLFNEVNRQCIFCGRRMKSSGGYTKHRSKCKARIYPALRTITNNSPFTLRRNRLPPSPSRRPLLPLKLDAASMRQVKDNDTTMDEDYALGIEEGSAEDAPIGSKGLKTSSTSYLEHFSDSQPGRSAGAPVSEHRRTRYKAADKDNEYYPYMNEADFALAAWFYTRELSKGDVTTFFEQLAFKHWHESLSFANSTEWLNTLHQIPYGIQDDDWKTVTMTIQPDANDTGLTEYIFYYRDIIKVIEFLIGHEPFADSLTYAPVQVYSTREKTRRLYHEMYTGDWWWERQKQLPDGATIIPLLLGTDKTLLTMHHGDLSVWPIYLTIGNLDAEIRRSQLKPSTVLLGFIPIPEQKKGSLDLKSAIWHKAMEQVLLRTFSVILQGYMTF